MAARAWVMGDAMLRSRSSIASTATPLPTPTRRSSTPCATEAAAAAAGYFAGV
jgi:hypothetical protein